MHVAVCPEMFDPWQELARYQSERLTPGTYGACCPFVGVMRDHNEGQAVSGMRLEHYPAMTETHLSSIAEQVAGRHDLLDTLILHRVGELSPGDPVVLVAVWSAHRREAFAACREIIEDLKSQAPFWKKERTGHGERWVEHNTPA